jgi:hypothetical protein
MMYNYSVRFINVEEYLVRVEAHDEDEAFDLAVAKLQGDEKDLYLHDNTEEVIITEEDV